MATLQQLVEQGRLRMFVPELSAHETVERLVYATPGFEEWIEDHLDFARPDRGDLHPAEQVEQMFHEFVTGAPLVTREQIRQLRGVGNGIWELKTRDTRILGFFHRRRVFVAVCGDMKRNLRRRTDYAPLVERVAVTLGTLDLDEPRTLPETEADAVL